MAGRSGATTAVPPGPGDCRRQLRFDDALVRQMDNTNTQDRLALSWASFMMGFRRMRSASPRTIAATGATGTARSICRTTGALTNKLRLSLGLRYERDGGVNERFNRTLSGGFRLVLQAGLRGLQSKQCTGPTRWSPGCRQHQHSRRRPVPRRQTATRLSTIPRTTFASGRRGLPVDAEDGPACRIRLVLRQPERAELDQQRPEQPRQPGRLQPGHLAPP